MNRTDAWRRALLATAALLLGPAGHAVAQRPLFGIGTSFFLSGAEGLQSVCDENHTNLGVATRLGYAVTSRLAVVTDLHIHAFQLGSFCHTDRFFIENGTLVSRERANLLSHGFVAADLALRFRTGASPKAVGLSGGIGLVMRGSNDLPYAVATVAIPAVIGPFRFMTQIEGYAFRVRFKVVERVWEDYQLRLVIPRETIHSVRGGLNIGLVFEARIPTAQATSQSGNPEEHHDRYR